MPVETDNVSGKIAEVKTWSSGKGFFLNLEGNTNDFYGFSSCRFKEGDTVDLEVKEGTGNFSDKLLISKMATAKEKKATPAKIAGVPIPNGNDYAKQKQEYDTAKNDSITRQCIIKASGRLCAGLFERSKSPDAPKVSDTVCYIADKLYAWVTREEEPLPEPPEAD